MKRNIRHEGIWQWIWIKSRFVEKNSSRYAGFSKGQKLIANFIINHYDKAAYMTAAKLEKKWE